VAEPIAAYPTDPITEYPTDPDKMPAVPWMTWIPSRRPEFKVHTDVGKAKSALGIQLRDAPSDCPMVVWIIQFVGVSSTNL
jgi:hypothetical protein